MQVLFAALPSIVFSIQNHDQCDESGEDLFFLTSVQKLREVKIKAIQDAIALKSSSMALSTPQTMPGLNNDSEVDVSLVEGVDNSIPTTASQSISLDLASVRYGEVLKRIFNLERFRKDQLEIISETTDGRDVFVLMSTGAGKSLCYQLPAAFQNEQTQGVTVVVSPLLALIRDQVQALVAKGVNAVSFTGSDPNTSLIDEILSGDSKPALLYVTPEMVQKSYRLREALRYLYRGGNLVRFAIDEAHCVSTLGQDFRDAYQELHTLRELFPGVPFMALTATANPRIRSDIIRRLKLENSAIFIQSLNRPNLAYVVKHKKNNTIMINDIISFINDGHMDEAGIIYCMTRKRCERLAQRLKKQGFSARHYHAKLADAEKDSTQAEWKSGKCRIIVATIAFGMGIDKANVRFVLHCDLPRSLDSYYQETGRAGRDGLRAECVLYYSFQDLKAIVDLVASIEGQRNARAVVQYCEEQSVCRRVQLLQHFGQKFDKKDCGGQCDNCAHTGLTWDMSEEAKLALALVQSLGSERITVKQCIRVFRGAKSADTRKNGRDRSPFYGAGCSMSQDLAELLFDRLLYLDILVENRVQMSQIYYKYYLKVGPQAKFFVTHNVSIDLTFPATTRIHRKVTDEETVEKRGSVAFVPDSESAYDLTLVDYDEETGCDSEFTQDVAADI